MLLENYYHRFVCFSRKKNWVFDVSKRKQIYDIHLRREMKQKDVILLISLNSKAQLKTKNGIFPFYQLNNLLTSFVSFQIRFLFKKYSGFARCLCQHPCQICVVCRVTQKDLLAPCIRNLEKRRMRASGLSRLEIANTQNMCGCSQTF